MWWKGPPMPTIKIGSRKWLEREQDFFIDKPTRGMLLLVTLL